MTSKQNKTEVRIASPPKETMSKKKSSPTKPKKPAVSKTRLNQLIQKAIQFHAKSKRYNSRSTSIPWKRRRGKLSVQESTK
ncbi:hypothetical protein P3T76_009439 [Phytophthora citrophthora]|uniref:Uncharacterized protein n=1 Tax=Phytophthora citrophthora TaxID=4793 RepID=A0AAD9LK23_9STRA|nr:hypothetical protein P3T76_009439 [Phytophthora citrophthora]